MISSGVPISSIMSLEAAMPMRPMAMLNISDESIAVCTSSVTRPLFPEA